MNGLRAVPRHEKREMGRRGGRGDSSSEIGGNTRFVKGPERWKVKGMGRKQM